MWKKLSRHCLQFNEAKPVGLFVTLYCKVQRECVFNYSC